MIQHFLSRLTLIVLAGGVFAATSAQAGEQQPINPTSRAEVFDAAYLPANAEGAEKMARKLRPWMLPSAIAQERLEIQLGETVDVEGTDLSLTFAAVPRDSRCPRDVTCIVAGEAIVIFHASLRAEVSELRFEIPPGGQDEKELERFTITIVELEPEADSRTKIDPADYVAKVVVTQSAAR